MKVITQKFYVLSVDNGHFFVEHKRQKGRVIIVNNINQASIFTTDVAAMERFKVWQDNDKNKYDYTLAPKLANARLEQITNERKILTAAHWAPPGATPVKVQGKVAYVGKDSSYIWSPATKDNN